jgi:hypothetical protein
MAVCTVNSLADSDVDDGGDKDADEWRDQR